MTMQQAKTFKILSYSIKLITIFSLIFACGCFSSNKKPTKKRRYKQLHDTYPSARKIPNLKRVKNAVPKFEPKSKCGNPKSYVVFNKRYKTLSTSRGYKARGIASFYGTKFHKHKTSNGEIYNMFKMTAAHKTLPIPTYVEVTNLKNGKKVIVRVNDRGPFHGKRIIDLSYAAAYKLGMLQKGTAYVQIKAINPRKWKYQERRLQRKRQLLAKNNEALKKNAITNQKAHYQIRTFRNKEKALDLKNRIKNSTNYPTYVKKIKSKNGNQFKVQIGPIDKKNISSIKASLSFIGITDFKKINK